MPSKYMKNHAGVSNPRDPNDSDPMDRNYRKVISKIQASRKKKKVKKMIKEMLRKEQDNA